MVVLITLNCTKDERGGIQITLPGPEYSKGVKSGQWFLILYVETAIDITRKVGQKAFGNQIRILYRIFFIRNPNSI